MEIKFTKHALQRMSERNISDAEVYEFLCHPFLLIQDEETILVGHTNQGKFLSLVMDQDRLITIWPASRKQRMMYQRRFGNEKTT